MKRITSTTRFADRLIALFDKLFMRHRGSDKFRILVKKPFQVSKQQPLKISQSHW